MAKWIESRSWSCKILVMKQLLFVLVALGIDDVYKLWIVFLNHQQVFNIMIWSHSMSQKDVDLNFRWEIVSKKKKKKN